MSIRARVLICLLLLVAGGFYYLLDWVLDDLRPRYLEAMEESLVDTATLLSAIITDRAEKGDLDVPGMREVFADVHARQLHAQIYAILKKQVTLRVYVTDRDGIVIFDSNGGRAEGEDYSQWNDVYLTLRGQYGARSTRTDPGDPSTSILYVASPLLVDGQIAGAVTVCKPVVTSSLFIQSARQKLITAGVLALLAVAFIGFITSAWVTRPIRKLTEYATDIRDGKPATLPELGHTEIGVMGQALEQMRTALEGKEYIEQYIQTLTHEIKGPLSAIRGAVELLGEEMPLEQRARFLKNLRAESTRIQRLVDRLLFLSSLQTRRELRDVEPVDMLVLLRDLVDGMETQLQQKRLTTTLDAAEAGTVDGERFLLRHALANLLQNAVDFAPEGSEIEVTARSKGEFVALTVADRGPGVPDFALDRVFESFYSLPRPESGEKSSGLGLTFVRGVAELHGGGATVENRRGGGVLATFRVRRNPNRESI